MAVMVSPLLLAARGDGRLARGYTGTRWPRRRWRRVQSGTSPAEVVLRRGPVTPADVGGAVATQALLVAMHVRMFVAVPLLLAAIFAAGRAVRGRRGATGCREDVPGSSSGLWAAAAYAVMVVLESRSVSRTYQHHVNRSAQHGSDDEDAS